MYLDFVLVAKILNLIDRTGNENVGFRDLRTALLHTIEQFSKRVPLARATSEMCIQMNQVEQLLAGGSFTRITHSLSLLYSDK
jgi:hypothetical protein